MESKENIKKILNVLTDNYKYVYNSNILENPDGDRTDREIYEKDISDLDESDIVVAEVSNPSLGVGYMISLAVTKKIPIITFRKEGTKLSAMINGSPRIINYTYDVDGQMENKIIEKIKKMEKKTENIMIIGAPGSGKGTISKILAEKMEKEHISTGEICRIVMKDEENVLNEIVNNYVKLGELVPEKIMVEMLINYLKTHKPENIILDGYPTSESNMIEMKKRMIFEPKYIIYLDISDETSKKRQMSRGERETDVDNEKIERRIKRFNTNITKEKIRSWYPNAKLIVIDAERSIDKVTKEVMKILNISPDYHFHIDPINKSKTMELIKIVNELEKELLTDGQIKITNVESLRLTTQTNDEDYSSLYGKMKNFHEINESNESNERNESFATGSMGHILDIEMMTNIINKIKKTADENKIECMIELERNIFETEYSNKGEWFIDREIFNENERRMITKKDIDKMKIEKDNKIKKIENVANGERHIAINIRNLNVDIETIKKEFEDYGLMFGGIFVFESKNKNITKIRTNEFTDDDIEDLNRSIGKLKIQILMVIESLSNLGIKKEDIEISGSIEDILGIWNIEQ